MLSADVISRYDPDPRSPSRARHAIRTFCVEHSMEGLVDDAQLLASEVMTNACRLASDSVTMVLLVDEGSLIVIIGDDCVDSLPSVGDLSGPLAESGRGLFVLDQVAGSWGTSATGKGKNVWFRLP